MNICEHRDVAAGEALCGICFLHRKHYIDTRAKTVQSEEEEWFARLYYAKLWEAQNG